MENPTPHLWPLTETEKAFVTPRLQQVRKLLQEINWLKGVVAERVEFPSDQLELDQDQMAWKEKV